MTGVPPAGFGAAHGAQLCGKGTPAVQGLASNAHSSGMGWQNRERHCAALINDYLGRIQRFSPLELTEVREAKGVGTDEQARRIGGQTDRGSQR